MSTVLEPARPDAALVKPTLERALADLRAGAGDLLGALVASADGLPIAFDMRDGEPAALAAMAATAAGLGKRIVDEFNFGAFDETVVRAEGGYLVVYSAGPLAVLAAIAPAGANLGRLHLKARRCAAAVAEVVV